MSPTKKGRWYFFQYWLHNFKHIICDKLNSRTFGWPSCSFTESTSTLIHVCLRPTIVSDGRVWRWLARRFAGQCSFESFCIFCRSICKRRRGIIKNGLRGRRLPAVFKWLSMKLTFLSAILLIFSMHSSRPDNLSNDPRSPPLLVLASWQTKSDVRWW